MSLPPTLQVPTHMRRPLSEERSPLGAVLGSVTSSSVPLPRLTRWGPDKEKYFGGQGEGAIGLLGGEL